MMCRRFLKPIISLIVSLLFITSDPVAAAPGDEYWSPEFHHAGISGTIISTLSQPEGLVVAGTIRDILATEVNNIARVTFSDGAISEVETFGGGLPGRVDAVGEHQGDLIAIGDFSPGHAARWDGESWQFFGAGLEADWPKTVVNYQGELFAGSFHWDGNQWNNFFTTDNTVTALIVHDGLLYVGGSFTEVQGQSVNHVFVWNGSDVVELGDGLVGAVSAAAVGPGGVTFCWNGEVNTGQIETWTGEQWIVESSEIGNVTNIAYNGTELVASTSYFYGTNWFGILVEHIATSSLGTWQNIASFGADQMTFHHGRLILSHNQSVVANVASPGMIAFDGEEFTALFPENNGIDQGFRKLTAFGAAMLATGYFEIAGGKAAEFCGVWGEGTWSSWGSYEHSMPGNAIGFTDVATVGYEVYGMMTYFDIDIYSTNLMKLHWENGQAIWRSQDPYNYNMLGSLQAVGDRLYIYGWKNVHVLDPDTGIRTAISGLDLDYGINDSCDSQSQLVICGNFTTNGGVPVSNVLKRVDDTWQNVGDSLPGKPQVVEAMDGEDLAVAYNDNDSNNWQVALFDGTDWTTLPEIFDKNIADLAYHGGRLFVAGSFSHIGPVPASGIAVWSGEQWVPVGSGLGFRGYPRIEDLLSTGDRLWVTGSFSSAGGKPSAGLAMWSGDPTLLTGEPSSVAQTTPSRSQILGAPFPNPFNPRTEINFRLAHAGHVRVVIYDAHGHFLKVLTDKTYPSGDHHLMWQGDDDLGRGLPSGVYFARLSTGNREESVKMTLLR